ncbi:hypothetical protein KP806_06825 [Paenibacillus sp. N4]|uniref:DUF6171 family protein n=1 Tax=Paenibacillus vietnamensis TaxID=2590547 RepID=UPI001CD0BD34|nr:DUF6171 family protein [Paenibacillus vietnamensis]MCA0754759.1 hypothetical protein [Paenibacillus vietnamensis]
MHGKNGSCKGCSDEYRVTEEQIDRILAIEMFRTGTSVPDDVYEQRLEHCRACPKLQQGTTCAVCGCFVRIAAKFKDRVCPLPGDSRWGKYA